MNFLELLKKPNLIAAHRGDRSQKPENTLSALASSIGKCDFIEIDVQLTKDLVPVIIHDDRITNQKTVASLREAGLFVNVFTVNKTKRQKKLFDWGVNGVFTDFLA